MTFILMLPATGNITKVYSYATSSYWVAEGSTFPYTPQGSSAVYTYAQSGYITAAIMMIGRAF
ncbi:MAG TPA: hypothetical protein VIM55_09160 [Mucilaginibacter sp.]